MCSAEVPDCSAPTRDSWQREACASCRPGDRGHVSHGCSDENWCGLLAPLTEFQWIDGQQILCFWTFMPFFPLLLGLRNQPVGPTQDQKLYIQMNRMDPDCNWAAADIRSAGP